MYSDDFGASWKIGQDVTAPGLSGENQLVQLATGELLTSIRINGAWDGRFGLNRTHMFAKSRTQGETWGKAYAATPNFPEVNCEGSLVVQNRADGGQRLIYSGMAFLEAALVLRNGC